MDMAETGLINEPKVPATKKVERSPGDIATEDVMVSSIVYMAAFDLMRLSRSAWLMVRSDPVEDSFSETTTRCRMPAINFILSLHTAGSNFPLTSIIPERNRWAARSITPDPHIPFGGLLSIVCILKF